MSQTNINIRMDKNLKEQFDLLCSAFGLNMSAAFNVFAKAVVRERKIPFEISVHNDPFYSESNLNELRKRIGNQDKALFVEKTMEELLAMEKS